MIHNPACKRCGLHDSARNVCVPGRGSDKPRFLFIGQNPGEREDMGNQAFIGPAGKVLSAMIEKYDLRPARVSNAVRCRTPGDREPKKEEVEACRPYLEAEIKQFNPEFLVAVGGTALTALTGKKGILDYAGRIVGNQNGSKVFALLHPAFILRSPKMEGRFEAGFKALKALSNESGRPQNPVKFEVITPGEAVDILAYQKKGFLTFDFETNGKYRKDGGEIRCVSLCDGEHTWVVPLDGGQFSMMFLKGLTTYGVKLCAHNSIFERRWLIDLFDAEPLDLSLDTMLLDYCFFEERMHDLESVAGYWLPDAPSWKIVAEMNENGWTWDSIPNEVLHPYSAADAFYTHKIMEKMLEAIKVLPEKERSILSYYENVLLPTSRMCARYEARGIAIDRDWIEQVRSRYESQMLSLRNQMQESLNGEAPEDFNPGSSQQVAAVLKKLGIDTGVKTDKGAMSVNSAAIEPIKNKHPFLKAYSEWKELKTLDVNFLEKFGEMAGVTGRIYPSFNPAFQVTGRISVSKPPAANIPKDPAVRGMVISRFEGGRILALDYRQLEMRLVASEAKEAAMLEMFKGGLDVHDETAKLMFGGRFTKSQRAIAKNINFGTIYGIQAYSLANKFNVPKRKAQDFLSRHRRAFPAIYQWMDAQHREIENSGQIKSRLRQIRHFSRWDSATEAERFRMMRQAGNFPIQSLGAHLTNLAACAMDEFLRENFKSIVFFQQHDAILVDLHPGDNAEEVARHCEKIMTVKVPRQYAPFLRVELPAGISITKRWGEKDDNA